MSRGAYRLVIWPEAEAEVADAAKWYEKQERGLGRDFLRAFRAATTVLRRNPFQYQIVFVEARRVLLRRFPYAVFFEIHGPDVVILGCLHTARDPREWQRRVTGR